MGRKSNKQKLIEKIFDELHNQYNVSVRDLHSGAFFLSWDSVQKEDVTPFFESQYGVALADIDVRNWREFAEAAADRILKK